MPSLECRFIECSDIKVNPNVANSPTAKRIGEIVRQLRALEGISQEELAGRCGIHRTYLGSIERGEKSISVEMALKLCAGLGVSLLDFLARFDDEK